MSAGDYASATASLSNISFANGYSITGTMVGAYRGLDLRFPNIPNIAQFLATVVRDMFATRGDGGAADDAGVSGTGQEPDPQGD